MLLQVAGEEWCENENKTLKQATGTMIPLVYVGSCNSDLIGFTYKMKKIKAEVDTRSFYVVSTSAFIFYIIMPFLRLYLFCQQLKRHRYKKLKVMATIV